ncbi:MAG: hypothetical protein R3Y05_05005 [bacterium]
MKKIIVFLGLILLPIFFINNVNANEVVGRIEDNANIFSTTQVQNLDNVITDIYNEFDLDVHFITLEKSYVDEVSYAHSYLREYYYDIYTAEALVIVFSLQEYNSSQNRRLEFVRFGDYPETILTDFGIDQMTLEFSNTVKNRLDPNVNESYYSASINLLNNVYSTISSKLLMNKIMPHIIILVISIIVSALVATVLVFNRGTKSTVSSRTYMNRESARVLGRYDRYMRSTHVRIPIETNSSSSGGGRSGGSSSRGRSF